MKRFASQLIYNLFPEEKLKRRVVEINDAGQAEKVFGLDDEHFEPGHTLFMDGVLTCGIFSPALRGIEIPDQYSVFDSEKLKSQKPLAGKDFIIDLGTEDPMEFTSRLGFLLPELQHLSVWELMSSASILPRKVCAQSHRLENGCNLPVVLWKNVDFFQSKIGLNLSVSILI